jgi:hypothetical protein
MSMNTRPFSVNVAAMVVALAMGPATMASLMKKQAFALEDLKHYTQMRSSCYNIGYNDDRQS